MAKYSVGGTEIINNSGLIDWSRITGTIPVYYGPQAVAASASNCVFQGSISASVNVSTGAITMSVGTFGGDGYNCACACG